MLDVRMYEAYLCIKLGIDISYMYVVVVIAVFLFFQHVGRPPFWIVTFSTPGPANLFYNDPKLWPRPGHRPHSCLAWLTSLQWVGSICALSAHPNYSCQLGYFLVCCWFGLGP